MRASVERSSRRTKRRDEIHETTLPRASRTTWPQRAASSGSWVTSTSVVPCSRLSEKHQLDDFGAGISIEIAGWLIGKDDFRIGDEGSRNGDALLLAAGELFRKMIDAFAQPTRATSQQHASACGRRPAPAAASRSPAP